MNARVFCVKYTLFRYYCSAHLRRFAHNAAILHLNRYEGNILCVSL